jgi:formyltetrahydrofolate synthetase
VPTSLNVNVVVAVNQFKHDTMAEIDAIKSFAWMRELMRTVLSITGPRVVQEPCGLWSVVRACKDNDENLSILVRVGLIKAKIEAITKRSTVPMAWTIPKQQRNRLPAVRKGWL